MDVVSTVASNRNEGLGLWDHRHAVVRLEIHIMNAIMLPFPLFCKQPGH